MHPVSPGEVPTVPARYTDLDQLVALDSRSFSQADRYRRREWAGILSQSLGEGPARIVVARVGGTVIGAAVVVTDIEAMHTSVLSLAVETRYRRTGLGRRLMCDALAQQSTHTRTVSLEVRIENVGARALYEQLGFRISRRLRKYYADGASALEYRAPMQSVLDACQAASNVRC
jgi:ribosomal protein S18 acetylase RimI-like enzyme